jgi:hypothetical protein
VCECWDWQRFSIHDSCFKSHKNSFSIRRQLEIVSLKRHKRKCTAYLKCIFQYSLNILTFHYKEQKFISSPDFNIPATKLGYIPKHHTAICYFLAATSPAIVNLYFESKTYHARCLLQECDLILCISGPCPRLNRIRRQNNAGNPLHVTGKLKYILK